MTSRRNQAAVRSRTRLVSVALSHQATFAAQKPSRAEGRGILHPSGKRSLDCAFDLQLKGSAIHLGAECELKRIAAAYMGAQ